MGAGAELGGEGSGGSSRAEECWSGKSSRSNSGSRSGGSRPVSTLRYRQPGCVDASAMVLRQGAVLDSDSYFSSGSNSQQGNGSGRGQHKESQTQSVWSSLGWQETCPSQQNTARQCLQRPEESVPCTHETGENEGEQQGEGTRGVSGEEWGVFLYWRCGCRGNGLGAVLDVLLLSCGAKVPALLLLSLHLCIHTHYIYGGRVGERDRTGDRDRDGEAPVPSVPCLAQPQIRFR